MTMKAKDSNEVANSISGTISDAASDDDLEMAEYSIETALEDGDITEEEADSLWEELDEQRDYLRKEGLLEGDEETEAEDTAKKTEKAKDSEHRLIAKAKDSGEAHDYPINVVRDVIDYFAENNGTTITEYEVDEMQPKEVLSIYLEWNGILGYTEDIVSIMEA